MGSCLYTRSRLEDCPHSHSNESYVESLTRFLSNDSSEIISLRLKLDFRAISQGFLEVCS